MVSSFDRYAGWLSLLAGITGLGYAIAFVVLKDARLSAVFLTLAPLLSVAGLVAVFERVRAIDAGYATMALAIGAFGRSRHRPTGRTTSDTCSTRRRPRTCSRTCPSPPTPAASAPSA
jgi:hypothetical protein